MKTHRWLSAACCLAAAPAFAADFPTKPLQIIVPFGAGGTPNLIARLVADGAAQTLGQPVVVHNQPGASGVIAIQAALNAPADGYTLLMLDNGQLAINPHINSKLPYDPVKSFRPITQIVSQPFLVFARSDLQLESLKDLDEAARKAGRPLNFASVGNGSPHHLCMSMVADRAGVELTHVPYKSVSEIVQSIMAGDIDMVCTSSVGVRAALEAGRAQPLAVASDQRTAQFPEVPTIGEALDAEPVLVGATIGLVVRAGTPDAAVDRLGASIVEVVRSPELTQRLQELGMSVVAEGPEAYASVIREELDRYGEMVNVAGVKLD
ncbi:MAG: tripartite tricarboxylate transporter substrate binding protein [Pigmentiphaga sp.]|nr:tripartite tricarboxylate transporter substrate binding protein [Pigmentiphaga sp.]